MNYTFWHNYSSANGTDYPRSLLAIAPEHAINFTFDINDYNLVLLLKLTCTYKYWGIKKGYNFRYVGSMRE